jgi:hypothetical protein
LAWGWARRAPARQWARRAARLAGPQAPLLVQWSERSPEVWSERPIAESLDPTVEDAYWSEHFTSRSYYDKSIPYDEYRPAYRYGWESRTKHANCVFEDIEPELRKHWESARAQSKLSWEKARAATRDAWDRIDKKFSRKIGT